MKKMFWIATLFVMCVATSYGQYNGECWVVSGGDTVYKLHANGNADPTVIPNLTQVSAAEVNPTNGVTWIAISASNAVYRYDQAAQTAEEQFIQAPPIERPNMISVNPADGTVWVAWLNGVSKLSSDGKQILAQVVPQGGPPNVETGRFNVAVNPKDGSVWIADARGPINRYDANGNQIATGPTMQEPKGGVAVDYDGNAWVADSQFNTLIRISPTGQELVKLTITSPVSPRVSPKDGSVWVVSEQSMLLNLSADGTKMHEFPAGMAVVGISLSPSDDGIWVADMLGATFSGEVSKFSTNGTKLFANPIPQPSSVSVGFWEGN
jgi:sugar lactone lactonase YvrE